MLFNNRLKKLRELQLKFWITNWSKLQSGNYKKSIAKNRCEKQAYHVEIQLYETEKLAVNSYRVRFNLDCIYEEDPEVHQFWRFSVILFIFIFFFK